MSIKHHILDSEDVLGHCSTKYWTWVCTDRRVLKYKQGKRGSEKLHDASFSDISGISLTNKGRENWYLYGAIGVGLFGIVMSSSSGEVVATLLGVIVSLAIGGLLFKEWQKSEKSFFEFKGRGVIRQEPEQWKILDSGADDSDEVREFVKMVRGQLG